MEDVKSEKIEYLFLDIEWNQAPGTSDLDGREAIQIGVVAADAQIQKVKAFSKAIRLSDPKLFNKKTEILSHTPLANIMQGNEEKAVLEKFAQSFPQYCHLIVWSRDTYELFLRDMRKYGITIKRHRVVVLQDVLGVIAGSGNDQIGFENALICSGIEYVPNYLHYAKHDANYLYQIFYQCLQQYSGMTATENCFANDATRMLHTESCRYVQSMLAERKVVVPKSMIFRGYTVCKCCGKKQNWKQLEWEFSSIQKAKNKKNREDLKQLPPTESNIEKICKWFQLSYSVSSNAVFVRTAFSSFKNKAQDKLDTFGEIMIEYRVNPKLPCKSLMEQAKKNLEELLAIKEPVEFFKTVDKKREDLLDDADDTAPVFDFFKGGQKKIFEKALEQIQMFENSKTYVREQEIIDNVAQMEAIVTAKNPFSQIQKLPDMSMKFVQQYGALLEKEAEEMRPIVDDDLEKVLHTLDQKEFASVFRDKFVNAFAELKQKLDTSHEIAAVKNIRLESDTLKLRCMDEITEYEEVHRPKPVPPVTPVTPPTGGGHTEPLKPVTPPVQLMQKKRKNVSISNVAGARTYTLETEEDIDKFAEELKRKLKAQLEDDTIIILS